MRHASLTPRFDKVVRLPTWVLAYEKVNLALTSRKNTFHPSYSQWSSWDLR